jgi:phospholipid/cholesterol/gamma-HCH transport system ATP-binding protein
VIAVTGLAVGFDGRTVLDGIDLGVERGELMAVVGKNGCGKSVLLKTIAGLIAGYEGSILVDGFDMRGYFPRSGERGSRPPFTLAYVFQKGGLFDSMNVFDNVAFGLRRRGEAEDDIARLVAESLSRVGLGGSEDKLPSELSGGMQKRVGLARAMCLNPEVILYDDPTAGLDPILSDSIADLILEITRAYRTTSIVVTHDLAVVRKISHSVALMYGGKIACRAETGDFFSRGNEFARQFIDGEMEGPIDIY